MQEPYGIVADPLGGALYVSDRAGKRLVRVLLATSNHGRTELVASLPHAPAGIDLVGSDNIVVAAGDGVYLLSHKDVNSNTDCEPFLHMEGAQFCGVNVAPSALGGDLFAINRNGNSLLRLARSSNDPPAFASSTTLVAGGNAEFPQGTWYEGTSHKVKLWGPTFGAFAHNSFIFSNSGRGGRFGKVLLLTDLYPMAGMLMPALCTLADAFGLSEQEANHAYNWTHAAAMLAEVRDVFDMIEEDNHKDNGATRGAEGPAGNFSNVCRRSLRQLAQLLQDDQVELIELGVPHRVMESLSVRSLMTLVVENYFTAMRARWPNPYSLQYQGNHSLAMLVQSLRTNGAAGYAFFTGPQKSDRHYTDAGSAQRKVMYSLRKPKPRSVEDRKYALEVLHKFARIFKQARQQRVTDKAKEKVGSRPSVMYEPSAILTSEVPTLQSLDALSVMTQGSRSSCEGSEEQLDVLFRAGDVVGVSGGRAGLWLAQLEENLMKITTPASGRRKESVKYNVDRPKVRYFVPTCELSSWPLAVSYWGAMEVQGAQALSESSNGVHFSFEKQDSVSCEAIYDSVAALECVRNSEGKLDRFAISHSDHQKLRDAISDLGEASTAELGGNDDDAIKWQHDGHSFIHRHVAVRHADKVSIGLITKWVPESEDGEPALWRMVHDDGDQEDLEEAEVRNAMELYMEESGQVQKVQQVSARGRKRTAVNVAQLLGKKTGQSGKRARGKM
eukprot:6296747-Prymnesium_polylepis.2